jgi:hypothetical protein
LAATQKPRATSARWRRRRCGGGAAALRGGLGTSELIVSQNNASRHLDNAANVIGAVRHAGEERRQAADGRVAYNAA